MKKQLLTHWTTFALTLSMILSIGATTAQADIENPVIGALGTNAGDAASSGQTFLNYFITIWQSVIFVGGLAVLLYFVWGGIQWIVAGGDASKIQAARDRMTNAVIGMIILVGSFVIVELISTIFFGGEYNLLNPNTEFLNSSGGNGSNPVNNSLPPANYDASLDRL
jgi:hypothetical protein